MNLTPDQQKLLKAAVFQTTKLYDDLGLSHDLSEYALVATLCTLIAGRHSKNRAAFDAAAARHLGALKALVARARERIPQ
jgi:hypothetical protein